MEPTTLVNFFFSEKSIGEKKTRYLGLCLKAEAINAVAKRSFGVATSCPWPRRDERTSGTCGTGPTCGTGGGTGPTVPSIAKAIRWNLKNLRKSAKTSKLSELFVCCSMIVSGAVWLQKLKSLFDLFKLFSLFRLLLVLHSLAGGLT